jgi:hypothetical protein
MIFLTSAPSIAATVSLAWDANDTSVDGYLLFMRPENGAYDYACPVWSGIDTACTIEELSSGTYYFVVRAYSGDAESGDSNEVQVTISDSAANGLNNDCDVDGLDLAGFIGGNSDLKLNTLIAAFGSVTCQ